MMPEPILYDDVLGTLTWDDRLSWYWGEPEIALGHSIRLYITPDDGRREADLARARRAYQHLQRQEVALREAAADALLSLYNEDWTQGETIDRDTFMRRITLQSISVNGGIGVEIDYNDGDLFAGHSIVVSLREDDTVQGVDIEG